MKRGDVFTARLDPVEGSEQVGIARPVIVVSRDAINAASPVVVVVPCTTYRKGRRIYPSQVLLRAPEGGLKADSLSLGEQVADSLGLQVVQGGRLIILGCALLIGSSVSIAGNIAFVGLVVPHIASASRATRTRMAEMAAEISDSAERSLAIPWNGWCPL